jgi:polyphosphate glucokinase
MNSFSLRLFLILRFLLTLINFMFLKKNTQILGIDIGGSGIKGAPVDVKTGKLLEERFRVVTPLPPTPDAIAKEINNLIKHYNWKGPVGVGFPAVVQNGIVRSATNIDKSFIGVDVNKLFSKTANCSVFVLNDADAAGIAEMKFGAGLEQKGVVLMVTVGTGIGTVLFSKRKLVPNTELGQVMMKGITAEKYVSDSTRKELDLSWSEWTKRFEEYLHYMENLFWPDLIIVGGGLSKKPEKFMGRVSVKSKIVPAQLLNNAGLIGAAIAARNMKIELD